MKKILSILLGLSLISSSVSAETITGSDLIQPWAFRDATTIITNPTTADVVIEGALQVDGGLTVSSITLTGNLALGDDDELRFGDSTDYWHVYDSANTRFELVSTDIDGGGTDGVVWSVDDGTKTVDFLGPLTQNVDLVGGEVGVDLDFSTSGSIASQVNGIIATLEAGYTGGALTNVLAFDNVVAGTSTGYQTDGTYGSRPNGNRGVGGFARASTVGHNIGGLFLATNGVVNYGTWMASTADTASASNLGSISIGYNDGAGGEGIGAYVLYDDPSAAPNVPADTKTALFVGNAANAVDIARFYDNTSEVFVIEDAGLVESTSTLADIASATNAFDVDTTVTTTASNGNSNRAMSVGLTYSGTQNLTASFGGMLSFINQISADPESGATITHAVVESNNCNLIDDGTLSECVGTNYSSLNTASGSYPLYTAIQFQHVPGFMADDFYAFDFEGDYVENNYAVAVTDDGAERWMPLSDANTGLTWDQAMTIATTTGDLTLDSAGDTVINQSATNGIEFGSGSGSRIHSASGSLIQFQIAGTQRFYVGAASTVVGSTQLVVPRGSTSTTGIGFPSDADTGVYSNGANEIGLVAGGTAVFDSDGSEGVITAAGASSGTGPTFITFTAPTHTGLSNIDFYDVYFSNSATATLSGGGGDINETLASIRMDGRTYAADAAQNVIGVTTLEIAAPTISGTNLTPQFFHAGLGINNFDAYTGSSGAGVGISLQPPGIADGVTSMNSIAGIAIVNQGTNIGLGNQTATLTNLNYIRLEGLTFDSDTNTRTVTNPATMYIGAAPTAGSNVTFTNPTKALHVDSGASYLDGDVFTGAAFYKAVTTVNAATYDLLTTDSILHVTYTGTGAVTSLTLPTAQCNGSEDDGRIITIKDAGGNATTNNITIDTQGSETIDGSATLVISTDYDSADIYCENSNWFIK